LWFRVSSATTQFDAQGWIDPSYLVSLPQHSVTACCIEKMFPMIKVGNIALLALLKAAGRRISCTVKRALQ
jgi:hypothetical protein